MPFHYKLQPGFKSKTSDISKIFKYKSIFFVPSKFQLNWLKNMTDTAVWNKFIKAKNGQIDRKLEFSVRLGRQKGANICQHSLWMTWNNLLYKLCKSCG